MTSLQLVPPPPLCNFVRCLWYSQGAPQTHKRERLLPNGEVSVIFNLQNEPIRIYHAHDISQFETHATAVVSGARANCFVIDTDQQERVLGIQFRPGGAFPFFRLPQSELEGLSVDLDLVWSAHTRELQERLLAARGPEQMFQTLEHFLLERLMHSAAPHPAVGYGLKLFRQGAYSGQVAQVCDKVGLSSRCFIEHFRRQVGLTPKSFCRVRRFQNVLQMVHLQTETEWSQVALACGYYDQPHFIHDFRTFSGLTPNAYAAAMTPHLNHVPLL